MLSKAEPVRQGGLQDVPGKEIVTEVCLLNTIIPWVILEGNQN